MVKRRPLDAITKAAARPVATKKPETSAEAANSTNPETVNGKPSTVNRKPKQGKRWDERTKRHTFHADAETLDKFKKHSKRTKESLAKLHNRAMRELLEREEQ